MERDPSIIRRILAATSEAAGEWSLSAVPARLADVPAAVLLHHVDILEEVGYLEVRRESTIRRTEVFVSAMTWKGHEVHDALASEDRWAAIVREFKLDDGGHVPLVVLLDYAFWLARREAGAGMT